jgi:hypothetical protein
LFLVTPLAGITGDGVAPAEVEEDALPDDEEEDVTEDSSLSHFLDTVQLPPLLPTTTLLLFPGL